MGESNKRKVALLGGEGFIGRNLAHFFSQSYECFSFGPTKSIFLERSDRFVQAEPYQEKIDNQHSAIIHLIDNSRCAPESFVDEEAKLVRNLALNDKNHLILFSSAVIYANPDSAYGLRKKMLEKFYAEYCEKNSIKLTIVRFFNTFGPFQIPRKPGSLIANIIWNHLTNQVTEISNRDVQRDFLYVSDIPKFIEYILEEELTGTYDLGSGKLMSIASIISLLENDVLKKKLRITDQNMENAIMSRAAQGHLLGKVQVTGIREALSQTVDFYMKNHDRLEEYGY